MPNPVPLDPVPGYYQHGDWRTGKPRGIHYPGDSVTVPLNAATGATGYTVQWWNCMAGTITTVLTGALTGSETSVPLPPPVGGWQLGWYRVLLTGPTNDALYGTSYSTNQLGFVRTNSSFPVLDGSFPGSPDFAAGWDVTMKGQLGIGTSRLQVDNVNDPTTGTFKLADMVVFARDWFVPQWAGAASQYLDSARPRYMFCQFPNQTVDNLGIPASGGLFYVWCYVKDQTINGSLLTLTVTGSSGTACTITVKYNGPTVETWTVTSAANAVSQINAGSAYIRVFVNDVFLQGSNPSNMTATAIGSSYVTGTASCVSALYAVGITRFEGPRNEPNYSGAEAAHQMKLFQAAVHAGNAAAKAIGPTMVKIRRGDVWDAFLTAGGGAYVDEPSTHTYNAFFGLACGRTNLSRWVTLLGQYGISGLPRWVTEGNATSVMLNSVHHPRRAGLAVKTQLLCEEYGIPRELNPIWYDMEHDFWEADVLEPLDTSPSATILLLHTLAEEVRGKTYQGLYPLPATADKLLIAQHWSGAAGGLAVFQLESWMPNATVTVATGAALLAVVDGFGTESAAATTNGLVTLSLSDVPIYVRIPTGETLNVVTVNGWPVAEQTLPDSSQSVTLSGTRTLTPVSGQWLYDWDAWSSGYPDAGGMVAGTASLPDVYVHTLAATANVRRALVFSGIGWQRSGTLLTFTVDYSTNFGGTWTNVPGASVDRSGTATTTVHGADRWGTGTQLETPYADDHVFDVDLGATISLNAIRLNVSAATYGGEPNSAAYNANGPATGYFAPHIVLQQVVLRG